jgi:hypothetical protein
VQCVTRVKRSPATGGSPHKNLGQRDSVPGYAASERAAGRRFRGQFRQDGRQAPWRPDRPGSGRTGRPGGRSSDRRGSGAARGGDMAQLRWVARAAIRAAGSRGRARSAPQEVRARGAIRAAGGQGLRRDPRWGRWVATRRIPPGIRGRHVTRGSRSRAPKGPMPPGTTGTPAAMANKCRRRTAPRSDERGMVRRRHSCCAYPIRVCLISGWRIGL